MPKIVLVTGGSRGIGAATARLAAQRGYITCLTYLHNQAAAEAVVADITRSGAQALAIAADVCVEGEVAQLFKHLDAQVGPVTALVNNAATLQVQMRLETMSAERIARILSVNVLGSMLCAREAVRRMRSA